MYVYRYSDKYTVDIHILKLYNLQSMMHTCKLKTILSFPTFRGILNPRHCPLRVAKHHEKIWKVTICSSPTLVFFRTNAVIRKHAGQLPSVTASRSLSKRGCARGSVPCWGLWIWAPRKTCLQLRHWKNVFHSMNKPWYILVTWCPAPSSREIQRMLKIGSRQLWYFRISPSPKLTHDGPRMV